MGKVLVSMAGKIFINYRRDDDAGFTQALYQRLEDEFTAADLFMDVEGHIKPGDDFVEVLDAQVAATDVLLAVIGSRWAELLAGRANDPDDFVAIEIKAALDKGKRVIPVLVGGASMPRAETLPQTIRSLARRNAVGLRPDRFKADCQGLITALKEQLAAAAKERAARTDNERLAAEAERKKREAEEAARIAAAERRAREQSVAGLSPDEIRKAEELANWDFIKERGDSQAMRDHLARFPGGVTALYAMTKLEDLVWAGLGASRDQVTLQAFLDEFPKGPHAKDARARLSALAKGAAEAKAAEEHRTRETAAWASASTADMNDAYRAFLKEWPNSEHAKAAKARLDELKRGPFRRRMYAGIGIAGALMGVAGFFAVVSIADITDALRPLPAFREPDMVSLPAGNFIMGSNDGTDGEKPPHRVNIAKPFAVAKYAVTFDEWDICVKENGCKHKPSSYGWGRATRPVINISWDDVTKEYLPWLNKKTGKTYRLLSEAEWEYAARAGTTTKYPWGDAVGTGNANCSGCGSQWDTKQTAPVGSFKPNAFGLYDMHGNVWQWCEDAYRGSYNGAPNDGSVWSGGDTSSRDLRGGSWYSNPQDLRSANRNSYRPDVRDCVVGFRLARTL